MSATLGFSYIGCLFLCMLFIPNLCWMKYQPQGYSAAHENRWLVYLERTGEILCVICALCFEDFNLHPWSNWSWWLIAAFVVMVLYEVWWIRYFRSERTLSDFYRGLLGIPVAGATLPVLAFFLLGVYGKVIWMMLAVFILGIGHIGIHLQHRKAL